SVPCSVVAVALPFSLFVQGTHQLGELLPQLFGTLFQPPPTAADAQRHRLADQYVHPWPEASPATGWAQCTARRERHNPRAVRPCQPRRAALGPRDVAVTTSALGKHADDAPGVQHLTGLGQRRAVRTTTMHRDLPEAPQSPADEARV